ncbi:MAG: recombinase family protein [Hyphomicrobiaceae bacterium]|nr:recombinase family protein [Hyphomicrobiaceae bacterium]
MQTTPPLKRAAQYVRMSTDQQQYSTINQKAAIALWAEARGIEIVATYEDAGKSGLTLARRPGLRQLIADALAGPQLFDAILVYDVSRWGRFQDADESAHLEYLCRSAGITVHYCAEQFTNDGSTMANLYKVMKRTLAAEYSRELSEKVKVGKARLASYGFRQGSVPGFGFRRRLLDQDGRDKGLLAPGERKSLTTDRVVLTLGPPKELATVRWIYEAYTQRGLSMADIRKNLNARGIGLMSPDRVDHSSRGRLAFFPSVGATANLSDRRPHLVSLAKKLPSA